jgi:hypothetical protein
MGKKKLTTPIKRGQRLIKRSVVSRCVSPWSSSLREEVPCLLAFIFTCDRKHAMSANTHLVYYKWVVGAVPSNNILSSHARGLALLVLSQVHS